MAAEAGHATGRPYKDQANGSFHLNGASLWNAAEQAVEDSFNIPTALSASGAISRKRGTCIITKAGVAVLTLAMPTATTDDGCRLLVQSNTANAHTIAVTSFNSDTDSNLATFGGAIGDCIELMAWQGKWNVVATRNVVLSDSTP